MISFKIENLPPKDREIVDRWADEQTNIQQSLANIVMHIVGYVGNVDVMDFDVQRKLHTIFANTETLVFKQAISSTEREPVTQQPTIEHKQQSEKEEAYSQATDLFEDD